MCIEQLVWFVRPQCDTERRRVGRRCEYAGHLARYLGGHVVVVGRSGRKPGETEPVRSERFAMVRPQKQRRYGLSAERLGRNLRSSEGYVELGHCRRAVGLGSPFEHHKRDCVDRHPALHLVGIMFRRGRRRPLPTPGTMTSCRLRISTLARGAA